MNNIKVSIITVVFNGFKTIEQTIKSVLGQTYKNIEYIIIDGGSTDGTLAVIERYKQKIANVISEPDNGIYYAMNKGIDMATGELIGIINSDDWYEKDCVENVVNGHLINNQAVIYGLIRNFKNEQPIDVQSFYSASFNNKMPPHPTMFVPKNIYNSYGKFDLKYKYCSDYNFVLRLNKQKVDFVMVEKVLVNFRLDGASSSITAINESFKMRYELGYISWFEYILKKFGAIMKSIFLKSKAIK